MEFTILTEMVDPNIVAIVLSSNLSLKDSTLYQKIGGKVRERRNLHMSALER